MRDDPLAASAQGPGVTPYLLRLPAVLKLTGLGRSTVYKMIAEQAFPAPVQLAKRAVAWRHDDVQRWTSGRPPASVAHGPEVRRS